MIHTIIVLAHKNISQVARLAGYFERDCDVFVHIDKKQKIEPSELCQLERMHQVRLVSRKYDVNWGGSSILECEIGMLRLAMEQSGAEYFHLISGQDYPVRPLDAFLDFFERNRGKEFLQYAHLPHPRWEENTYRRFQYFYPYDQASDKPNPRAWVWQQVQAQRERGIKRPIPDEFDHLYGGSQWFSITRGAVQTLLEYTEQKPSLYQRMWMTFAPEETYVATVLVNLLDKERIENSNHRLIRWKHENGNRPANLGPEHFHLLFDHEYLFARKVELSCSMPLLDLIDRYLLQDQKLVQMSTGGWVYDGFLGYGYDGKFCGFVAQFCKEVGVCSALDMGCGAGLYVNKWVRADLPFVGYDANPHTPALSRLLLPEGEPACGVADLTGDLDIRDTFDLVVCKDVLQHIPEGLREKAICNLALLSSHYIILNQTAGELSYDKEESSLENDITLKLKRYGYMMDEYMTARSRLFLANGSIGTVYRKTGKDIIINKLKV